MGSSDVGDVANIMHTFMLWGCAWPVGVAAGRPWPAREVPSGSRARFRWPVYVLANDASLIAETKKAFMVRHDGKAYCSIEKLLG